MPPTLLYTYALAKNTEALHRSAVGLRGIANSPITLVHGADPRLIAAVGPVPAQDFEHDALARHFEDLDWLEQTARAHHAVVAALAAVTTVLPLRLATVYLDEQRLRSVLDDRRQAFTERLAYLEDSTEWGVKLYLEADTAAAPPDEPPPSAASSPGRAYLQRRRAARDQRDDARMAVQEAAEHIMGAALSCAVEQARHRPQQGRLASSTSGENLVNDAYLVPNDRADAFRTAVLRAADRFRGIRVDITGPWAPYSFTGTADSEAIGETHGP
jgi:hypothetical protein